MGICILPQEIVVPSSGPPKGKTLNEYTWEEISYISSNGLAGEYGFAVGDEKNITLSTDEALTLAIMDFDHDDLADGTGKAGITFGLKNLMTDGVPDFSGNTDGFIGSPLYTKLIDEVLPALPTDLQAVLKTVNKKTSAGGQSTTIITNAIKLFLFCEIEVFGETTYSVPGEGMQYTYFTTQSNRIKFMANGAGNSNYWWQRSPYKSGNYFLVVSTSGGPSRPAGETSGICFGFCV